MPSDVGVTTMILLTLIATVRDSSVQAGIEKISNLFLVATSTIGMTPDGRYGFLYVGTEKGLRPSLLVNPFYKYAYLLEGCRD